jgi:hypothetical protein
MDLIFNLTLNLYISHVIINFYNIFSHEKKFSNQQYKTQGFIEKIN